MNDFCGSVFWVRTSFYEVFYQNSSITDNRTTTGKYRINSFADAPDAFVMTKNWLKEGEFFNVDTVLFIVYGGSKKVEVSVF